jgi:hypothetical protein
MIADLESENSASRSNSKTGNRYEPAANRTYAEMADQPSFVPVRRCSASASLAIDIYAKNSIRGGRAVLPHLAQRHPLGCWVQGRIARV